jgi:hypothetical protein
MYINNYVKIARPITTAYNLFDNKYLRHIRQVEVKLLQHIPKNIPAGNLRWMVFKQDKREERKILNGQTM